MTQPLSQKPSIHQKSPQSAEFDRTSAVDVLHTSAYFDFDEAMDRQLADLEDRFADWQTNEAFLVSVGR